MNENPASPVLAYLEFLSGPLADTIYPITQPVITLGRASDNDVVITDLKISRSQARLSLKEGVWQIERLSDSRSVKVDQQNIDQATLAHNVEIKFGESVTFRFLLEAPSQGDGDQATLDVSIKRALKLATVQASPSELGIHSLEVVDNTTGERKEYALTQDVVNVGRDPGNDIVLAEDYVADFHLQITRQNGQWTLLYPHPQTSETEQGLLANGQRIAGKKPFQKQLRHNDIFRIENQVGAMITLKYSDGRPDVQEFIPRMQVMPLETDIVSLGRDADNTIPLLSPQVSAHHAQLVRDSANNTYRLTDLNSTNHTYVNGLQVTNHLLQQGDEIRIGSFKLVYGNMQLTLYDESGGIRIDVLDLKQVRNNRVLLNDISLSIPQRSFVALVGSSGAGKSTLLSALSGLQMAVGGSIYYNGQDYYQHLDAFKTQIGYVPQDEIIHRDLSVERALYYTARLRLPKDFTDEQIEQRIDEVLTDVEMQHRRHLLVSKLSGGQRKRVSIALELLAKPSIFFLDEPTSGLDPGLDRRMMVLLRKLADKGHTIVLVTHATNNINVCDFVCFLAPGGHLTYYGPPEGAKAYFKQPDFAEIYGILDPGDGNTDLPLQRAQEFLESDIYEKYIEEPLSNRPNTSTQLLRQTQKQGQSTRRGLFWRQFRLLTARYIELLRNDQVNLLILLLQAPIIGLLLIGFIKAVATDGFNPNNVLQCPTTAAILSTAGFPDAPTPLNPVASTSCQRVQNFLTSNPVGQAYAQKRGGVKQALQDFLVPGPGLQSTILFVMAFSAILFGCTNAIREFVKEAPIYRRERAVNLGILPYMLSKIVVLGFLCLVQSLILVGCVAIFDPYHRGILLPPFLEIYITISLTSFAGLMIGLAVSAVVSNNDRAVSFVPLILLPQVLFSGAIFPLTNVVLQYLGMLFPIRWSMAALGSSVGLHSDKINGDQIIGTTYTYIGTLYSTNTTEDATRYLLLTWGALVLMLLILGICSGIFLKRKDARV
ncbi:MAG TPA: FHA domain-containing protein [Ktedonobacteraceae bacterium]